MKKIIAIVVFLLTAMSAICQTTYKGWKIDDPLYFQDNVFSAGEVTIANMGNGNYSIKGFDNTGNLYLSGEFTYKFEDSGDYIYAGTLDYQGEIHKYVSISTALKLSTYLHKSEIFDLKLNILRFIIYDYIDGKLSPARLLKFTLL